MNLSWSAFHAHHEKGTSGLNLAISSLLPLFEEQSSSPTMSRHSMDVHYLNPGQPPAMACDQPLFDITKQIQWISSNSHEEDLYVIMLGEFHIVLNGRLESTWKMVGQQWIDSSSCSRWHNIAAPGKADYFFKGVACIQYKTCTLGHSCSTLHSVAKGLLIICWGT